jgi:hypothetical protein
MRATWIVTAIALASVATPQPARAAILDFYYVGAPYRVANYPTPAPALTTGLLRIDASKLPTPGDLRHLRIDAGLYDLPDRTAYWPDYVLRFEFSNRAERFIDHEVWADNDSHVSFDAQGKLAGWYLTQGDYEVPYMEFSGTNGVASREYVGGFFPYEWPDEVSYDFEECQGEWGFEDYNCFRVHRRAYLERRGYEPGTPRYETIVSTYDFTRVAVSVDDLPGRWFTDPLAFAAQVEIYAGYAARNPALNVYDIAPVPLPAPAGLAAAGVAALLVLKAARRGVPVARRGLARAAVA